MAVSNIIMVDRGNHPLLWSFMALLLRLVNYYNLPRYWDFVSFPMKSGDIFHTYVNVYQRVECHFNVHMITGMVFSSINIMTYIWICKWPFQWTWRSQPSNESIFRQSSRVFFAAADFTETQGTATATAGPKMWPRLESSRTKHKVNWPIVFVCSCS